VYQRGRSDDKRRSICSGRAASTRLAPEYDPVVLYGRDAEREVLGALLEGVRASKGGVLVLRGDPGVGKSALLADLVARAGEMQVVRSTGVESESELAFAGVHQLVWPLLEKLDEIPAPQAGALRGALGLDAPAGEDRFLIGVAVLSLLAVAADVSPLLCLVDDAHWLDEASEDALTFAARRLHAEPIAMIFAAREGERRNFEGAGLPELHVSGLDPAAAGALLADRAGVLLSHEVREQLVASANGNPLALLELPAALSEDQLAGRAPLRERVPVTHTIEAVFLRQARELPPAAQQMILLAAADDTTDAAVVLRAATMLGLDAGDLDTVERTGLLRVAEGEIRFRHPLVRSAVYEGATFGERQLVHRALADALEEERFADRRVWHRAAATLGPDDELADELDRSAAAAFRRGGHVAAAAALERAAAFTGEEGERARRLAAAAAAAWLGGRVESALALIESAGRLASDPATRGDLEHLRAQIELQRGSPARAHEILMAAAAEIVSSDPARAGAMLVQAGEAANYAGDLPGEIEAGRAAGRLRAEFGLQQLEVTMMAGVAKLLEGEVGEAASVLAEAISQVESSQNPRRFSWAGSSSYYLGDIAAARTFFDRFVEDARAQGAISLLAVALALRAYGEVVEGRFASAVVSASEGFRLASETGQQNTAAFHQAILAWAAARFGKEEDCRAGVAEVFGVARERGLGIHTGIGLLALGELELASGRPSESLSHLEAIWEAGPGSGSVSVKLIGVPDLVEAASRVGTLERAHEAFSFYENWVTSTGSRFELPVLCRCRGLLSPDSSAGDHFREALRLHAHGERPFERARTELVYGEMLRRGRHPKEAREHLRIALELFEQLGATAWTERARTELRGSGETARKRDPSTVDQLTPQELQIARIVAGGASNKEAAAQLFLSPRTIEFHLRHVFAKLGITSRAQLAGLPLRSERPGAQLAAAAP
jgi:DNA-binding CsgD family transcriptional regulator